MLEAPGRDLRNAAGAGHLGGADPPSGPPLGRTGAAFPAVVVVENWHLEQQRSERVPNQSNGSRV